MPDRHIRHTRQQQRGTAWCGVRLTPMDWQFQDIDHAAYNQMYGSVPVCPDCVRTVTEALNAPVVNDD